MKQQKLYFCYLCIFVCAKIVNCATASPILFFSDIDNGQNKGNSDTSKGQTGSVGMKKKRQKKTKKERTRKIFFFFCNFGIS